MTVLSRLGRNIRFLCSEFNLKYSSFDNIACHKDIASLFHNNQYDRCHDFDINRFNVLLEMLMTRDGVMTLQTFCSDEINAVINDICTQ